MRSTVLEMGRVAERIVAKAGSVITARDIETALALEHDDDQLDRLHRDIFTMLTDGTWDGEPWVAHRGEHDRGQVLEPLPGLDPQQQPQVTGPCCLQAFEIVLDVASSADERDRNQVGVGRHEGREIRPQGSAPAAAGPAVPGHRSPPPLVVP